MATKTKHSIVITIDKEGNIQGKVEGVAGKSCGTLSSWLEELGTVTYDGVTPDWYKPDGAKVEITAGK